MVSFNLQLYVVSATSQSGHSRLFAFALLPDEKTLAYNLMWIHLKELLGNHYTATSLLCNIELAAIKLGKLILKLCLFANILSRFSFKSIPGSTSLLLAVY